MHYRKRIACHNRLYWLIGVCCEHNSRDFCAHCALGVHFLFWSILRLFNTTVFTFTPWIFLQRVFLIFIDPRKIFVCESNKKGSINILVKYHLMRLVCASELHSSSTIFYFTWCRFCRCFLWVKVLAKKLLHTSALLYKGSMWLQKEAGHFQMEAGKKAEFLLALLPLFGFFRQCPDKR